MKVLVAFKEEFGTLNNLTAYNEPIKGCPAKLALPSSNCWDIFNTTRICEMWKTFTILYN
jgi:hypothetical protein